MKSKDCAKSDTESEKPRSLVLLFIVSKYILLHNVSRITPQFKAMNWQRKFTNKFINFMSTNMGWKLKIILKFGDRVKMGLSWLALITWNNNIIIIVVVYLGHSYNDPSCKNCEQRIMISNWKYLTRLLSSINFNLLY